MAAPLTRALGAFVADMAGRQAPAEAMTWVKTGFTDTIGTMVAGSDEPVTRVMREVLGSGEPESTILLDKGRTRALDAALINGAAAHALDYDDVAQLGHTSTVLVPAILAEGEALGVTGERLIAAYVTGYEVWAELVGRETDAYHVKGWHPTGIFGAVAAGAACAMLNELDATKAAHAIGIAASQSAGLMANFGSMTKPFHAGRSASAGLLAARAAKAGMTASPDAIEHAQGFLKAVSPQGKVDIERDVNGLGQSWRIASDGVSVKKYPACYCTHRSLDAILDLLARRSIEAGAIDNIDVTISKTHATILRNHAPTTGLAAKFSMEFAMASAVIAGNAGLRELTDPFVQRDDVQALMKRVTISPRDTDPKDAIGGATYDSVRVTLKNGEKLASEDVKYARGHAAKPLSESELYKKFADCLTVAGSRYDPAKLFEKLQRLEHTSARDVAKLN
jgi:2-methylcitrate dehydratase PrpD